MSCGIYHEEGSIKIKKENMKCALGKLADYFEKGNELVYVDEFDYEDIQDSDDYEELWSNLRYEFEKDKEGNYIITDFTGENLGNDDKLFELIAPYCENGYLQFHDDDGEHFRYVIKNGEFEETYPSMIWQ